MAHDYDGGYHVHRRHDSHYSSSRDTDPYSRHAARDAMHSDMSAGRDWYSSRHAASPRHKRTSNHTSTRTKRTWPPSPSVEDEQTSLSKELRSSTSSDVQDAESGEAKSRGSVDQEILIEDVEQPPSNTETSHDRRFVLVSDPRQDYGGPHAARDGRRKSFAERGNMAPLKTDVSDEPRLPERISTPYAYTKPQKESLAPSPADLLLSPELITVKPASSPTHASHRDGKDRHRDQNKRPQPPSRDVSHSRHDSLGQSPKVSRNDVFDDSDSDDINRLRRERQPARYSFVKTDLQKEDLRTNLIDARDKREAKRPEHLRSHSHSKHENSTGSPGNYTPGSHSPRSSDSSVQNTLRTEDPSRSGTQQSDTSSRHHRRHPSRPVSPLPTSPSRYDEAPRSPRLHPKHADAPTSRPSSRNGPPRPISPLSSSTTWSPSMQQPPIVKTDWHATYPPVTSNDVPRESRFNRHETMPVPLPTIGVQSPSPVRRPKPKPNNPLPYPVDERPGGVFMPPEEIYQFDHSQAATSPRVKSKPFFPDVPPQAQSPVPTSPRNERPSSSYLRSQTPSGRLSPRPDDPPRSRRVRSNSVRSQSSLDGRRGEGKPKEVQLLPMIPSCPRSEASSKHEDWYTLENCPNFDICPTCYNNVFAQTAFADLFTPVRSYDERFCDFSTPWMRLAWLLTLKQRRNSPELLYRLATIDDIQARCPKDGRSAYGMTWYGIQDLDSRRHISNFAICACDMKKLGTLCPTVRDYFSRLPSDPYSPSSPEHICALRTNSKRFRKYLDLLVDLDIEAQELKQHPDMGQFIKLARENAFRLECRRDRELYDEPWHFIPSLPQFTVCEECFNELVYPAMQAKHPIAKMFYGATRLVPNEGSTGTSCCLYSPRMRGIWKRVLEKDDFRLLMHEARARKEEERRMRREERDLNLLISRPGALASRELEVYEQDLWDLKSRWQEWE